MAPNTQIGMIHIDKKIHNDEHITMYSSDDDAFGDEKRSKYSRGGEFLDNMMSDNVLEFGRRWMGLGDLYNTIDDIKEFYEFNNYHGRQIDYNINDAVFFVHKDYLTDAVKFDIYDQRGYRDAVTFHNKLDHDGLINLQEEIKKGALL